MNGFATNTLKLLNLSSSSLRCRFISSLTTLENQSTRYPTQHDHFTNPNTVHLLCNPTSLRGLNLKETKIAHNLLFKTNLLYSNIVAANNLLACYSKCDRMDFAFKLFDEIPERLSVTWNLVILGCNKNSLFDESWRVFCQMHKEQVGMDEFSYGSVLSTCGFLGCVVYGEKVYGLVIKSGFFSDGYVRAGMVDLFTKNGKIENALKVLYDVPCENVVCWNAAVSGAVKNNDNKVALEVFCEMCSRRHGSLLPNSFTFSSALTACAALEHLEFGKTVQGWVIKSGAEADVFVGTATVDFYSKCGAMSDAVKQFKLMPTRNVVSWTAIISGFVRKGDSASAVLTLTEMHKTGEDMNNYTVSSVLAACANPAMFPEAMQIHCWILKIGFCSDSVVKASLITMYSKIGAINLCEVAFAETCDLKKVGIWNSMIFAHTQNNDCDKAAILFKEMLKFGITPDHFSTSSILSIVGSLNLGRQLHVYTLKNRLASDISVGSSIFTMYSKCGNLEDSVKAFEQLEAKDNVAWTSMIAGFAEHGCPEEAVRTFRDMLFEDLTVDELCISSVLTSSSALSYVNLTREIHGFSIRHGFGEQSTYEALLNAYSKCDDLNSAWIVFNTMPYKDHISVSSLVSGFVQRGLVEEALCLFQEMLLSDMPVDDLAASSILGALANLKNSDLGMKLHARTVKLGLQSDANVGSALVMMYSKCGSIDVCSKAFDEIRNADLISWTAIIASYAHHGKGSEALNALDLMKKSGIKPDAVTLVSVLSACNHSGLVEEGYAHFNLMLEEYGIEPSYKHYGCMVDLLGRAGRLEEALRFICNMPTKPDTLVWETLLAACKVHGNYEIGKQVSEKIMELRPSDAGAYISSSNVYADAGEWGRVMNIRGSMKETGVGKKEAGWSFV